MMTANSVDIYARADIVSHYQSVRGLLPPEKYLYGRYVRAGMEVLDIGVGGGRTSAYLSTSAKRYLGIDYSAEMVAAAQRRYPALSFEQGDATDLKGIADASFDAAIFSFNGLDCIPSDAGRIKALSEMRRVTRPKGVVIVSSHNARHLLVHPVLVGVPAHKKAWRVARAVVKSVPLALRNLRSGLYRRGHGFTTDPVHGGHYMHASTPESMARDAAAAGLRVVEHVGASYPKRLPDVMNSWETYVLAHA
jgi:SAM-dependent methyltransferase